MPEIIYTFRENIPESLEGYDIVTTKLYEVIVEAFIQIGQKPPSLASIIAEVRARKDPVMIMGAYDDLEVTVFISDEKEVLGAIKTELIETLKVILGLSIHASTDFAGTLGLILTLNNGGYRFLGNVNSDK